MFDFVHLGLHKSNAASATTTTTTTTVASPSTGKALKQIVLTGGAGRNRLVLELDGGNTEAEADLVQTWFEVSVRLEQQEIRGKRSNINNFLLCWVDYLEVPT